MKNIEKLLEQQRQIAAQIAAARAAHARLQRLGAALAKHPEILGVLSDREIVEALRSAAAAAAAAISPQALGTAPAEPVEKPGRGKESLNGNTQAVAGSTSNADDYA